MFLSDSKHFADSWEQFLSSGPHPKLVFWHLQIQNSEENWTSWKRKSLLTSFGFGRVCFLDQTRISHPVRGYKWSSVVFNTLFRGETSLNWHLTLCLVGNSRFDGIAEYSLVAVWWTILSVIMEKYQFFRSEQFTLGFEPTFPNRTCKCINASKLSTQILLNLELQRSPPVVLLCTPSVE